MKKQNESKLSLVDRLKRLKTKHGDASKKKSKHSKKDSRGSKEDFEGELPSGSSPPQSSTSLIKLSHMIVETLPTNPECDTSQTRKLDTTAFDFKEPQSDITIQRINTASFSMPQATQMDEISLLKEDKPKVQIKNNEDKPEVPQATSLQNANNESSVTDSRIISFEKSVGGSFFSTNLSSLLKDRSLSKQKFLPKSNKIAPIIVSSRGKESKYISFEERMNLQGLQNDSDEETPMQGNMKSPY